MIYLCYKTTEKLQTAERRTVGSHAERGNREQHTQVDN